LSFPWFGRMTKANSPLFEVARVLVSLDSHCQRNRKPESQRDVGRRGDGVAERNCDAETDGGRDAGRNSPMIHHERLRRIRKRVGFAPQLGSLQNFPIHRRLFRRHRFGSGRGVFRIACCPPGEYLDPDEQIATGHFCRLREPKQEDQGRSYVGQDPVLDSELRGIGGHVDEVNEIRGVGSVGRAIRVAHELAVAVVGGYEALPA
jgi:hypothetical protein